MYRILTNNDNFRYSKSINNYNFKTKTFQSCDYNSTPFPIKPTNNIITLTPIS